MERQRLLRNKRLSCKNHKIKNSKSLVFAPLVKKDVLTHSSSFSVSRPSNLLKDTLLKFLLVQSLIPSSTEGDRSAKAHNAALVAVKPPYNLLCNISVVNRRSDDAKQSFHHQVCPKSRSPGITYCLFTVKGLWCNWIALYIYWSSPFSKHSDCTYFSKWCTAIDLWWSPNSETNINCRVFLESLSGLWTIIHFCIQVILWNRHTIFQSCQRLTVYIATNVKFKLFLVDSLNKSSQNSQRVFSTYPTGIKLFR